MVYAVFLDVKSIEMGRRPKGIGSIDHGAFHLARR